MDHRRKHLAGCTKVAVVVVPIYTRFDTCGIDHLGGNVKPNRSNDKQKLRERKVTQLRH